MEKLFLNVFNMSITAGWLILALLLFRLLFRKANGFLFPVMWGLVGLRLVIPFSIESVFSLVPSAETIPEKILSGPSFDINSGIEIIDSNVNDYLGDRYFEGVTVPTDNGLNAMRILSFVWLIGVILMLFYTVIGCIKIKMRIRESVKIKDNIFMCDRIDTPFIFGIINPKIYLPSAMDKEDERFVIAHEKAHIKRLDFLWKPSGFLILSFYWFNPLVWVAYILFCRDIETACDCKVIKELGADIKKSYANALINCSATSKIITACPLAFGETGVKKRVKSVLNYKKPVFWVVILAIITAVLVAVAFLTNPHEDIDIDKIQIVQGENYGSTTIKVNNDNKAELILEEVITKGKTPYAKAVLKNYSDDTLCYGEKITLYRNDKEIKISEGYGWDDILYTLAPGKETEIKISLGGFDVSKNGYYKLEKEFYLDSKPQEKFFLFINFSVAKDGSAVSETQSKPKENQNPYFEATVVKILENGLLVEPDEKYHSGVGDLVSVSTSLISKNPLPDLKKGDRIRVVYNGEVLYSYPGMINDVFAIYLLDNAEDIIYYKPLLSVGIKSAELLGRDKTTTRLQYASKAIYEEIGVVSKFEKYLNEKFCEEREEGNWVKFNPARPNDYAFALHLENGETLLLNIHFSQNPSNYYIALGTVAESFSISKDYSDIPCKRYVADKEFGKFLENLIQ